jgi:hypothetical protein
VTALAIGTAVIPKRGEHSAGVHRRFVPAAGRTLSCQVGLGLFLSDEECAVPVDWELALDGNWREDAQRLRRARIPDEAARRPEWAQVLDLVERRPAGSLPSGTPLVADLPDLDGMDRLSAALRERGVDYLLRIPAGRQLAPAHRASARPAATRRPESLLPPDGARNRLLTLVSVPVEMPGAECAHRLWAHRPSSDTREVRYYLTSMADTGADRIAALLRHVERARGAVSALGNGFGMLHFAGRSFPGWHHHMTMASAAYAYSSLTGGSSAADRTVPGPRHGADTRPAAIGPTVPALAGGRGVPSGSGRR